VSDPYLPAPVEPGPLEPVNRWRLIRDLVVFQIKLVVDGLKDLVLGPLSLIAGIIDIVQRNPASHSLFRGVVRAGASFDRWVGLFDDVHPSEPHAVSQGNPGSVTVADANFDAHLRRLEQLIIAQQQRGGMTASAKLAIDRTLDLLEKQLHGHQPLDPESKDGTGPGPTPYSGP
jgi:hypothetical protein